MVEPDAHAARVHSMYRMHPGALYPNTSPLSSPAQLHHLPSICSGLTASPPTRHCEHEPRDVSSAASGELESLPSAAVASAASSGETRGAWRAASARRSAASGEGRAASSTTSGERKGFLRSFYGGASGGSAVAPRGLLHGSTGAQRQRAASSAPRGGRICWDWWSEIGN